MRGRKRRNDRAKAALLQGTHAAFAAQLHYISFAKGIVSRNESDIVAQKKRFAHKFNTLNLLHTPIQINKCINIKNGIVQ